MTPAPPNAVVVGFQNLGGLAPLAKYLRICGCNDITLLVDDPKLVRTVAASLTVKVEQANVLSADDLVSKYEAVARNSHARPVFLCIQDRAMLAFIRARERCGSNRAFPAVGIRNARIKPIARRMWGVACVERIAWSHLSYDSRSGRWAAVQSQGDLDEDGEFFVKPVCGMASELVRRVRGRAAVDEAATTVREKFLERHRDLLKTCSTDDRCVTDETGTEYDIFEDVIVEEALLGVEYTLDGIVADGHVAFTVQQKETRHVAEFVGDGLIVSPPQRGGPRVGQVPGRNLERAGDSDVPMAEFYHLLKRGLDAIDLDNWVFHAEAVKTEDGLKFVELNPRPAGGLLWRTAELKLGTNLYEAVVRFHLGIPVIAGPPHWVTGQFPIYAEEVGVIKAVDGVEAAKSVPFVDAVLQVAFPKDSVDPANGENYVVFVSILAPCHETVRETEWRVRQLIKVHVDRTER